jgi:hypothetical protein
VHQTGDISRRAFIKQGGGAALSTTMLGSLLAACGGGDSGGGDGSSSAMLKMTNDKIAWKKWFAATGNAAKAADAIGWTRPRSRPPAIRPRSRTCSPGGPAG